RLEDAAKPILEINLLHHLIKAIASVEGRNIRRIYGGGWIWPTPTLLLVATAAPTSERPVRDARQIGVDLQADRNLKCVLGPAKRTRR
ncbi:hypothetical protein ACDA55_37210, partial [Rhizobium ruizarguesonis]